MTPRQDTLDFMTAFAVGTVLGIGATLLLRPERTPKERVVRQLKPYRKKMQRSYGQAREAVREGSDATSELTAEIVSAGRDLLGDFGDEVARILSDARSDLREQAQAQAKELRKGARKTRRKLRI